MIQHRLTPTLPYCINACLVICLKPDSPLGARNNGNGGLNTNQVAFCWTTTYKSSYPEPEAPIDLSELCARLRSDSQPESQSRDLCSFPSQVQDLRVKAENTCSIVAILTIPRVIDIHTHRIASHHLQRDILTYINTPSTNMRCPAIPAYTHV